jgi:hypothetical protein
MSIARNMYNNKITVLAITDSVPNIFSLVQNVVHRTKYTYISEFLKRSFITRRNSMVARDLKVD